MLTKPHTVPRPAALVVVLRIVLVALAAGAVVTAFLISRGGALSPTRRYVCPMHSEVTASAPGDCPICGMALEELDRAHHVAMPDDPATTGAQDIALTALRASTEASNLLRFSVAPARRNAVPGEVFAPAVIQHDGTIAARLYRDELATLAPDERAEFVPSASPDAAVAIRRAAGEAKPRGGLVEVGFRPERGAAAPPAGQIGWVKLAYRTRDMLIVRTSSVIQSADGPYVLVFSAQRGTVSRRRVEVGTEYMGLTAIVSGLRDKEFVVMANTFSFDAERRLQAAP